MYINKAVVRFLLTYSCECSVSNYRHEDCAENTITLDKILNNISGKSIQRTPNKNYHWKTNYAALYSFDHI